MLHPYVKKSLDVSYNLIFIYLEIDVRKHLNKPKVMHCVLLIGDTRTGKTTLMLKLEGKTRRSCIQEYIWMECEGNERA